MVKKRTNVKSRSTRWWLVSILLCVALLIGTTFAWFTDTATSGQNTINAGNLDIGLRYSKDGETWTDVEGSSDLFTDVNGDPMKWEPGAASVAYLEISNMGALALEYDLAVEADTENEPSAVNVEGEEFKLSDYLQFSVVNLDAELDMYEPKTVKNAGGADSGTEPAVSLATYVRAENTGSTLFAGSASLAEAIVSRVNPADSPAVYTDTEDTGSALAEPVLLGAKRGFRSREELISAVEAAKKELR